jgi:hypothetical protein
MWRLSGSALTISLPRRIIASQQANTATGSDDGPKVAAVSVFALLGLSLAATASAAVAYDGAAAAAYADTYWQNYNPAWPSFANRGPTRI